jgi:hypothetical protein
VVFSRPNIRFFHAEPAKKLRKEEAKVRPESLPWILQKFRKFIFPPSKPTHFENVSETRHLLSADVEPADIGHPDHDRLSTGQPNEGNGSVVRRRLPRRW